MYSTQGEQLKDWGVIRVALIKKYGIMWEFSPNVVDDFVKMLVLGIGKTPPIIRYLF